MPVAFAFLGVAAFAVSLLLAFTHERVTVRPIAASAEMSRQQAEMTAQSTARLWAQEVRSGHTANIRALTCAGSRHESDAGLRLATVGVPETPIEVLGYGDLEKDAGPVWSLPVFFFWPGGSDIGKIFHFAVEDGEMRLCDITAPPAL